jgi:branched-chain amino acid transport system permease protein
MDASFLVVQFLNGLATASSLFIASCGLTIIFGVTRIVNFAHGSLYMLGAYIAVTFLPGLLEAWYGPLSFWAGILLAALAVGLIGVVIEVLLLRRIYHAPELFQLLATFGVVLVVQDLVVWLWGPEDILGPRAPGLKGAVTILGQRFPEYEIALILAGPIVLVGIWLLLKKTRFGVLVRAATQDREMVGALGVNQALLFTGVVFLGAFLAGLAGALQVPKEPANPFMDINIIAEAFVVTVIGGMGSVPGAFIAALLIGELQAFGILVFPKITLVLVFLVMAVVLIVRPWGLLGRPEVTDSHAFGGEKPIRPYDAKRTGLMLAVLAALAALPLLADAFTLKLMIEVLIFALFAMSLNFMMGTGGIISFGHAAYFGLGAYGAALVLTHLKVPMELALMFAPIAAGIGAAAFGAFVVRLSGVYLAMLTLAFAQIVYAIAFQWVELTGGDNGLIGIWPSQWASDRTVYYYLTLLATVAGIYLLRRGIYAPFGYGLRAARDSERRAGAIGIDIKHQRWLAFTIAGVAAGLAGGLYTFSKGNIDPTALSIPTSVDALTMVLLGGIQTVLGPTVGAAFLYLLRDFVMPLTDFYRLILGAVIIALVLVFPQGIVGFVNGIVERRGGAR